MRVFKYIIGIWAAITVYTLFSFFSGPKGVSAYSQLSVEKEAQWSNILELANINEELERTKNSLVFDYDTLMVHARQMGFAQENERFIRIVGLGSIKNTPYLTGNVYFAKEPDFLSDKIIKITAFCAGLLLFTLLLILEIIDSRMR